MATAPKDFGLTAEQIAELDQSERFGRQLSRDEQFRDLIEADARIAASTGFDDLITAEEFSRRFRDNEKKRQGQEP